MYLEQRFSISRVSTRHIHGHPLELKMMWCPEKHGDHHSDIPHSTAMLTPWELENFGVAIGLDSTGKMLSIGLDVQCGVPGTTDAPIHKNTRRPVTDLVIFSVQKTEMVETIFGGLGARERKTRHLLHIGIKTESWGTYTTVHYPLYSLTTEISADLYEVLVNAQVVGTPIIFRITSIRLL